MSDKNNALGVQGAAGITTDDQTNAAARRAAGEFVRGVSSARHWISNDQDALYPVESGRYHLYVAYNCPWCHRVLLGLAVMGLQDAVTVNVLFPNRSSDDEPLGPNLWKFCPEGQTGSNGKHTQFASCTTDTVNGKSYVKEVYELAGITDQKSVPILYCKKSEFGAKVACSAVCSASKVSVAASKVTLLTLFVVVCILTFWRAPYYSQYRGQQRECGDTSHVWHRLSNDCQACFQN